MSHAFTKNGHILISLLTQGKIMAIYVSKENTLVGEFSNLFSFILGQPSPPDCLSILQNTSYTAQTD